MKQVALMIVILTALTGCGGEIRIDDPRQTLAETPMSPQKHIAAMEMLDAQPEDEAYLDRLHRIIWAPGYTIDAREAALARLEQREPEKLQRTIRQQLPRMTMPRWHERLCAMIAERGWMNQTPALISSWARPMPYVEEKDRAEYQALVKLHGRDRIADVVYQTFVESDRVAQRGLRGRAWDLLHRIGERDRLVSLLADGSAPADDPMLVDLQRAARDLGMVPHNRHEILWLRKLLTPEYAGFWSEAVSAMGQVPMDRRAGLDVRDLPVVVAAARHEPGVLSASKADLYQGLESRLRGERHYSPTSSTGGVRGNDRLRDHRDELTWGDLVAMRMALRALEVPQVVAHLFDYADRDHVDESTEYGGVIQLDPQGRFEILEFPPRVREHDQKFHASQAMFDSAYVSQFHFHFHAQRHRHAEYAGPGLGDRNYADNQRANCLVLTFIDQDRMNVDYYRYGGVVVDLGTVERVRVAGG